MSLSFSKSFYGISTEYENRLFDTGTVHTVEIQTDTDAWNDLKDNALYKEYYDCNVTIDGETFYHVGVRTKGNTTLIQSIVREWERYSLVLNFGAFDQSQRYYGLDKVALNNNICDSSFIRDYLCYDMMREMGIPTPLCSFVQVSLNGDVIGLYTAVESLAESFALRNYGTQHGQMYKPEQMDIAGMIIGTEKNGSIHLSELSGENGSVNACDFLGVDDKTVGLQYQGEDFSLYDAIWNNAVFKVGKKDKTRLINAIRTINESADASSALDTDTLLRYFAVNTFVLNDDCYTSYAGHNYGLYEENGKLSLIPWDYDHALGCTGAANGTGNWTDFINTPIDEPLIDTTLEERPLLHSLLASEENKAKYHDYLDKFLKSYIVLEKKSKFNTLCGKESTRITKEQCQRLIDGDTEWPMQAGKPLCRELYAKMQCQLLRPRVVVDYTRRAFVYAPGNVRVTIDDEVRSGLSAVQMFESFVAVPADIRHPIILEVKYDAYCPSIIRDAVQLDNRRTSSFSKYAACRLTNL